MGKVHRIKKSFRKLVSQQPLQAGTYSLNRRVTVHIGRSYGSGVPYAVVFGNRYEKLVQKLMREYNGRAM